MKKYLLTVLFVLAAFIPHLAHADITSNLVIYYPLNDGSGTTAADLSGNSNTGTLTNGPTWTTGNIWPSALQFANSSKTYVLSTNAITPISTSITWAAWVFPTAYLGSFGTNSIISLSTTGSLFADGSGQLGFGDRSGTTHVSTTVLPTNTWSHVAVVCVLAGGSSDSVTLYVNGSQVAQFTGLTTACNFNSATMHMNVGGWGPSPTSALDWTGKIQEARVYSRALSSSDITQLFQFTAPSTATFASFVVKLGTAFSVMLGTVFKTN